MAKAVDLLSYWMPVLRNLKEFKEIAKALTPEIELMLAAIDSTLNNLYIETADEAGIARFESIVGITPKGDDSLASRRNTVLIQWNNATIYTRATLNNLLTAICGEGNFSIEENYAEYSMNIHIRTNVDGMDTYISNLLSNILPCNLAVTYHSTIDTTLEAPLNAGVALCSLLSYQIGQNPIE